MSDTVMGETLTDVPSRVAGRALRAAREKAGFSVEDVAAKLKLSPRQVVAIEAEDWPNLPERTFTRGFFYSYARLVDVEKKVIDASFTPRSASLAEMRTLPAGIGEVTHDNTAARSSASRWLIPLALLALLAAGVAWFLWKDIPMPHANANRVIEPVAGAANTVNQTAESIANASSAGTQNTSQPQPLTPNSSGASSNPITLSTNVKMDSIAQTNGATTNVAGTSTSTPSSTNSAAPTATAVTAPTATAPTSTAVTAPSATQPAPAGAIAAPAAATTSPAAPSATAPIGKLLATGERRISITVDGRSWAEARASGNAVLSEMLNNTSREFVAKGPVSFVIGSSSNVKLSIDGKPYDFSKNVRNEVARFTVE
ncbi:MAG: helix-turn-helix domain-containing protein [Casimicrobium sp.]